MKKLFCLLTCLSGVSLQASLQNVAAKIVVDRHQQKLRLLDPENRFHSISNDCPTPPLKDFRAFEVYDCQTPKLESPVSGDEK